ncbi:MAG: class I SAM-dependent methyltransferase, partial [Proteobacteria bacterium]|nr:class I SAM-dependent methyltransferase [Pseudomonadota bacterium]
HYGAYFAKIHEVLAEDGVVLLHTIGRSGPGTVTDPWIRKYIFPGGYIPALSEVVPHIEKQRLIITDIEFLGPHYAETLRLWRERFCANWSKGSEIYDDRFCRMWEFYLAGSEIAFRYLGLTVFQIQMVKRRDALPMTRDYISEWERNHPNRPVERQASDSRFA